MNRKNRDHRREIHRLAGHPSSPVLPLAGALRQGQRAQLSHAPGLLGDGGGKGAIVAFHDRFPLEGYRRLTFVMIDMDVAYVAPATTYRILKAAGRLDRWNRKPSLKGTGFVQPKDAGALVRMS